MGFVSSSEKNCLAAIAALLKGDGPSLEQRLQHGGPVHLRERHRPPRRWIGPTPMADAGERSSAALWRCRITHRVRRQLRADGSPESLGLLMAQGLERAGGQGSANDSWMAADPISRSCCLAGGAGQAGLAAGDHDSGRQLDERIWQLDGELELLHRFLPPGIPSW